MKKDKLCRIAAGALLIFSAVEGRAETYEIGATEMQEGIAGQFDNTSAEGYETKDYTFAKDGVNWILRLEALPETTFTEQNEMNPYYYKTTGYFATAANQNGANVYRYSLITNDLSDKVIESVEFCGGLVSYKEDPYLYEVSAGGKTATAKNETVGYMRTTITPVTLTLPAGARGELRVSTMRDLGGGFVFKSLKITYSAAAMEPVRGQAVQVGHVLYFSCDEPGSTVYYSINGEEFAEYDSANPPTLETPGMNTVRYYSAAPGKEDSGIVTETIEVAEPNAFAALIRANSPMTVKGYVSAQGAGYTLIVNDYIERAGEAIAVDNSTCTALASARVGDEVELTGRPTDRFTGFAGIGSISDVTVNGAAATTAIQHACAVSSEAPVYDLQGRPASRQTSRPRLLISEGRKEIVR